MTCKHLHFERNYWCIFVQHVGPSPESFGLIISTNGAIGFPHGLSATSLLQISGLCRLQLELRVSRTLSSASTLYRLFEDKPATVPYRQSVIVPFAQMEDDILRCRSIVCFCESVFSATLIIDPTEP